MEAQHTDKEKGANSITSDIDSDKERTQKILDTQMDVNCMKLLATRNINAKIFDTIEQERAKRTIMNYDWHNNVLMFQDLVVTRLEERDEIMNMIHEEIGHFSKQKTFVEVKRGIFGMLELNQ